MSRRNHQFDLLRIVFAALVLLAHAPDLIDGNHSRELLSRLTHTGVTLGDFAVDGFFLLSGFLIVSSWLSNPSWTGYLTKRLLRIAPGYIVATLLSTIAAGLIAPGVDHFFSKLGWQFYASLLILKAPHTPPAFPNHPYHSVNGSLWTIFYEFSCYLVVMVFGLLGLLRSKIVWPLATVLLFCAYLVVSMRTGGAPAEFDVKFEVLRLFSAFFLGGCFRLAGPRIHFGRSFALAAVVLLILSTRRPWLFEPALMTCGGYLLFYFGKLQISWLGWMRDVPDVSYGMYVYGWPVQMLLLWYLPLSPWVLFVVSAVLCFLLGLLSWSFVERPMLALKRHAAKLPPAIDAPPETTGATTLRSGNLSGSSRV